MYACGNGSRNLTKLLCFAGSAMPSPDEIKFGRSVKVEVKTEILKYLGRHPLRQIILGLVSAKTLQRIGTTSYVKLLNVDLIRKLFYVLGR
jgi:hypothetical protein